MRLYPGEGGGLVEGEGICNSGHNDCAITTDRVEGFDLGFWNDIISCNFVYGYYICQRMGE